MPRLPVVSGQELVKALENAGFRVVRQKGSHVSLQKENYRTVVALHHQLARGTLLGVLKQCGLSRDDLEALLEDI